MTNLHQRLNTLDGIRMTQSDDDIESYWEIGTELLSMARHILQSGLYIIFLRFFKIRIIFEYEVTIYINNSLIIFILNEIISHVKIIAKLSKFYVCLLGRNLVSSMSRESSKDALDMIKEIHKLLDAIELKQVIKCI